jgi:hypothetical protein
VKDDMKHELRSDYLEWDWLNPSCTSVCCGISETIVAGIKGAITLRLLVDLQTPLSVESCTTEATPSISVVSPVTVCEPSRLRKNDAGPPEIQWSGCMGQQDTTSQEI